jgi:hypothetical protein
MPITWEITRLASGLRVVTTPRRPVAPCFVCP